MTTDRQLAANRQNAQRSAVPRAQAGKAIASRLRPPSYDYHAAVPRSADAPLRGTSVGMITVVGMVDLDAHDVLPLSAPEMMSAKPIFAPRSGLGGEVTNSDDSNPISRSADPAGTTEFTSWQPRSRA